MTGSSALPKQTDFSLNFYGLVLGQRAPLRAPAASLGNTAHPVLHAAVTVQPQTPHFSNQSCFQAQSSGKCTYSVEIKAPFKTSTQKATSRSWQQIHHRLRHRCCPGPRRCRLSAKQRCWILATLAESTQNL